MPPRIEKRSPSPARGRGAHRSKHAWIAAVAASTALLLGPFSVQQAGAFDLQGHRGARGVAPENTLAGFRAALADGATTLETDLAVTRDDHLVLSHDPVLNPEIVRDATGRWITAPGRPIRSHTLEELRRYDVGRLDPRGRYAKRWNEQRAVDGERIPTLQELFALVREHPGRIRLNIETKITPDRPELTPEPARFARLVVDAVRRNGFESRVTVQSFDWRTLREVRRIAPEITTSCLTIQTDRFDTVRPGPDGASAWHAGLRHADHGGSVPRLVQAAGCNIWSMYWRDLTPELTAEARALGLGLLPWTVNETEPMQRLIDMGVDGIITDYPGRLRALLAARGITPRK
ncbi:MAG: glycerophosphodiester phosphodiesterase [Burkholderiales bacterium]|nr:MAG: glycerophosphodiester phosphodiesterase [Burkholderiales bacterium]